MKTSSLPDSGAPVAADFDIHQAIRRRAEEIDIRSGRVPGRDLENWSQAEAEIKRERPRPHAARMWWCG